MFVCLGNICRSPLAHAIFENLVSEADLDHLIQVESSGTGAWHEGEPADLRMRKTARRHALTINHRAQRFRRSDCDSFNLLLTMDRQNYEDVLDACIDESQKEKVRMFRDFDPRGPGNVPDPWYGGPEGFEEVWQIVERTCIALLEEIRRELAA